LSAIGSHRFAYDVVGQGVCAVDYLCRLPRYPRLDEKTELVEFSMQGGGPVPTALVALSRLGARTCYLGKVGDDQNGHFVRESLEREGVDTAGLVVDPGARTPQAFVWIDAPSGLKSIAADRTGLQPMRAEEMSAELASAGRYLLIDGKETQAALSAARWARQAGAEVVLDVGSPRSRMEELLRSTDYLVASKNFVEQFGGARDPLDVLRSLADQGPQVVLVTLGRNGCICLSPEGSFRQPAFSVPVVDTTGAGDVFHGGFIYGLLRGWDLSTAVRFASAMAALKCRRLGGRAGIPTLAQVENFLFQRSKRAFSEEGESGPVRP
jgi:ribokinase